MSSIASNYGMRREPQPDGQSGWPLSSSWSRSSNRDNDFEAMFSADTFADDLGANGSVLGDGARAFRDSLQAAMEESSRDAGRESEEEGGAQEAGGGQAKSPNDDVRILAEAGAMALPTQPLFFVGDNFAPAPSAASGETPAWVEDMIRHLEAGIRQELGLGADKTIRLKLQLEEHLQGHLQGLEVSISRDVLEVTLVRSSLGAPEELIRAAEALAQRLQFRFPGRMVRVLEAKVQQDADPVSEGGGDGLGAISKLLQQANRPS